MEWYCNARPNASDIAFDVKSNVGLAKAEEQANAQISVSRFLAAPTPTTQQAEPKNWAPE